MKTHTSLNNKQLTGFAALGCCSLFAVLAVAYLALMWWAVGVALDWANQHYHLGLGGAVMVAVHVLAWLVLSSLLSGLRGSAKASK